MVPLLLVFVAVLVWLAWRTIDAPPETVTNPPVAAGRSAAPELAGEIAARTPVHSPAPASPAVVGVVLQVHGRLLAAESSAPLPGVRAVLHLADEVAELGGAVAGDDGTFAVEVTLPQPLDVELVVRAPGRAPVEGQRAAAVGRWDLGDVLLARMAEVRGEVVDRAGQVVEGAQVMLRKVFAVDPPLRFPAMLRTVTDARGAFRFADLVAAGEWHLGVDRTGALVGPRTTLVPAGGEHFVRLEVERPDPAQDITGRVVDATGLPLAGVELAAYGDGSRGRAISGADGTFVVHRGPPHWNVSGAGVELTATDARREQVVTTADGKQVVAWGQRDTVVVMHELASVTVLVVDDSGRVRHDVDVLLWQVTDRQILIDYPAGSTTREADGSVRCDGLRRCEHVLLARPRDPALAIGGPLRFVVDATTRSRELTVTVPRAVAVAVEVVDAAGRPVPRCELSFRLGLTQAGLEPAMPAKLISGLRPACARGEWQLALAEATTAADGVARLHLPPGACQLLARSRDHLPACRDVVVAAGASPLRVVLAAATVLRGRLVPAAAVAVLSAHGSAGEQALVVTARPLVEEPLHSRAAVARSELARAVVAADGSFTLGPLPPGGVGVVLHSSLACNAASEAAVRDDLGVLDTAAGADGRVVEREFDVAGLLPSTVQGEVRVDGRVFASQQFFFVREAPLPKVTVRVPTAADGRFTTRLPPGEYSVRLAIPAQPGPGHVILPLPQRASFTAGQAADCAVDARTRRLTLRLLGADGAPLAERRLRFDYDAGYNRPGALATDGQGRVVIDPAPFGAFVLFAATGGGEEVSIGPLSLPPGDGPLELEFRVGG
ncbi:MAG: carboxypeptidase regulatory-like domain-containing protein [Planctomycetes bacterium]|nr:carboxypeptidase regulatory-like domain-containing protein [Planctomycetota bacterium]